jgi:hypothetical protein
MSILVEVLPFLAAFVCVFGSVGMILWSITTIRYHIDPACLRITWMGLPVRRIPLHEIKSIGHRSVFWAERWYNTLRGGHRLLVIRRSQGFFRTILITPKNYLVFKAELERARKNESSLLEPQQVPVSL